MIYVCYPHSFPLNIFTSQNTPSPHNIHTSFPFTSSIRDTMTFNRPFDHPILTDTLSSKDHPFFNARFLHHRTMQVHTFFSLFCQFQKRKLKVSFRRVYLLFSMACKNLVSICYDRAFNSDFEYQETQHNIQKLSFHKLNKHEKFTLSKTNLQMLLQITNVYFFFESTNVPRFPKTYKIQRKKMYKLQTLFNLEEDTIELRNLMVRDGSTCAGESSGVRVVSH